MKFPLPWIADYTELPGDDASVAEAFTQSGSEVEGVESVAGETVFDFGITVNRPDCMNVYGLAREASVLFGTVLKRPDTACSAQGPPVGDFASVTVEAPDLCPRYAARVITGVSVGESPAWMKRRLEQCGVRPINAVVDVTNYVLLELGHPLHAFDLATLGERRIVVRRAAPGERITTLDGVDRVMKEDRLVIADASRPVALAGVMGGEKTGVTEATTDILLEAAVFNPVNIRRTSKTLGLHTEASHRFERGVDGEAPPSALDRAAKLILEIAGGRLAEGILDERAPSPERPEITLRHARVEALIGMAIPPARCEEVLASLGFSLRKREEGVWGVRAPSFRVDVGREADLIEEIIRIHGLTGLEPVCPGGLDPVGGRPDGLRLDEKLRDGMTAAGCSEAIHMSMTDPRVDELFAGGGRAVRLANPLSPTASVLRRSLLGPIGISLGRNRAVGNRFAALFEIGNVYAPGSEGAPPSEERRLAVLLFSDDPPPRWGGGRAPGLLHLKGMVEAAFGRLGISVAFVPGEHAPYARGLCLEVRVDDRPAGWMGTLSPGALASLGLKSGAAHCAEVSLDDLAGCMKDPVFVPFSRYPGVVRDFSFLLDRELPWSEVRGRLKALDLPHLQEIRLIDTYEGKGIPPAKKSVTFSLVFRSLERTLTEKDTAPLQDQVADSLSEAFGAILR